MSIILAVGSAWMKFSLDSADPGRILVEVLSAPIVAGLAPFAINLRIESSARVDLGISINFLRKTVQNARDVWREIKGSLESAPGFKFVEEQISSEQEADQSKHSTSAEEILGG